MKKESKDRLQKPIYPGNQGATPRLIVGRLLQKALKYRILERRWTSKMWSVSSVTRKDTMPTNVRMQRRRMGWAILKSGSSFLPSIDKKDEKSTRHIRIRNSDFNSGDPFLRYWIKIYDLSGPVRDPSHPGYLAHVFVDTGANCNTVSSNLFEQLINRGLDDS